MERKAPVLLRIVFSEEIKGVGKVSFIFALGNMSFIPTEGLVDFFPVIQTDSLLCVK